MNDRIQKLLTSEGIQPTKFAEIIGVQRSSISHILSGRNKPSFDVIQSILRKFPRLNSEWLIMGSGEMYKKSIQTTLFDNPEIFARAEKSHNIVESKTQEVIEQNTQKPKAPENRLNEKEIERVVVFFNDKTFTEYRPD
ncbi:MAG: hypothetical protein CVT98_01460 [Bacteroidetes bacterium HGW-Bacteroidetes-15]|nr:MAG: hypothetical protein CVT98_01460 [Bacteroidetes bacterium HGW-Bacteroidetes-15]